jgi:hypothetical protein
MAEKKLNRVLTDEVYKECSKNPYLPASFFAAKTKNNSRYMTTFLTELVVKNEYESIKVGNTWYFRPK